MRQKQAQIFKQYRSVNHHKVVWRKRYRKGRKPVICNLLVTETRRTKKHTRRRIACTTHKVRYTLREN